MPGWKTLQNPHFRGISFVAPGEDDPAAAASRNEALFEQIEYLAYEFTAARLEKATAIARRVAKNALEKLSPEFGRAHPALTKSG